MFQDDCRAAESCSCPRGDRGSPENSPFQLLSLTFWSMSLSRSCRVFGSINDKPTSACRLTGSLQYRDPGQAHAIIPSEGDEEGSLRVLVVISHQARVVPRLVDGLVDWPMPLRVLMEVSSVLMPRKPREEPFGTLAASRT